MTKRKRIFVMLHEPTERICPVKADNAEEARAIIAARLGISLAEARKWPIYDADNRDDIMQITSIIVRHMEERHERPA
jgi:hypothetical protein